MIFGWLQPLNALVRPHAPKDGETRSELRLGWEVVHKLTGYAAIIMAICTIFLGIDLAAEYLVIEDYDKWRNIYAVVVAAIAAPALALLAWRVLAERKAKRAEPDTAKGSNSDVDAGLNTATVTGLPGDSKGNLEV